MTKPLTDQQRTFLRRFVGRGWLHTDREDLEEREAVKVGLRAGYLRRELGEAHFTPAGREALEKA